MAPNYAELAARAEAAVAALKDPELKRIAFQKILDDLITSEGDTPAEKRDRAMRHRAARTAKPKRASKERASRGGPGGYLTELVDEGYFAKPKTMTEVKGELENRGHHIPLTSLSGPLQRLCQRRTLRRSKVKTSGKKQTYAYSNW